MSNEMMRMLTERLELAFKYALKWVPVDYWCDTHLDAMRKVIEDKVRDQIGEHETWGMKVEKRRWQQYHTRDIIVYLTQAINRKVDLDHPDKLVRVDVIGNRTAVSVLRPDEIFSMTAPSELAAVSPPTQCGQLDA